MRLTRILASPAQLLRARDPATSPHIAALFEQGQRPTAVARRLGVVHVASAV
jgi:hypothetical protein